MKTKLPAGLIDQNVEVFDVDGELHATHNGRVYKFLSLPEDIIVQFFDLLIDDEEARKEFEKHNIKDMGFMLEEYTRCNFGAFDNKPDLKNGRFHREFWACPRRGNCIYNEKICPKIKARHGEISRREIDIIKFISKGLSVKQIADKLFISEKTARTHVQNIHAKTGLHNNAGVTAFAFRNNIIK
ncbi:MAG: response regulator transcription factor [Bacteroidota bacterium]